MRTPHTAGIVIAGAGIGGLALALSLHAAGIKATVIDTVREIKPLGAGINLQPNAVGELTELGLGNDLAATAIPTAEHLYIDQFGNRVRTEPRGLAGGYHWPQYSIHRGKLQMLLLSAVCDRLGATAVRTGTRLQGFDRTPDSILVQVINPATGAVEKIKANTLIGADGLHSTVRAQLYPDQTTLRWSGVQMWRGMTEIGSFLDGRTMVIANDNRGSRLIAYPISRRLADRGRTLVNWVCLVRTSEPGPLAQDTSWNHPGRLDDVLTHYVDWDVGWLDVSHLLTNSEKILEYPMVDRDPLPGWGHDRVTLLGDAAHLMYPIGANGASQAIVDARTLACALASTDDPVMALNSYEKARRPTTAAIVHANREMDRAERKAAGESQQDLSGAIAAITDTYRDTTESSTWGSSGGSVTDF